MFAWRPFDGLLMPKTFAAHTALDRQNPFRSISILTEKLDVEGHTIHGLHQCRICTAREIDSCRHQQVWKRWKEKKNQPSDNHKNDVALDEGIKLGQLLRAYRIALSKAVCTCKDQSQRQNPAHNTAAIRIKYPRKAHTIHDGLKQCHSKPYMNFRTAKAVFGRILK